VRGDFAGEVASLATSNRKLHRAEFETTKAAWLVEIVVEHVPAMIAVDMIWTMAAKSDAANRVRCNLGRSHLDLYRLGRVVAFAEGEPGAAVDAAELFEGCP
jgi:hypothetical protein